MIFNVSTPPVVSVSHLVAAAFLKTHECFLIQWWGIKKIWKTLNEKPIQKTHWPWTGSWKMLPYFGVLAHDMSGAHLCVAEISSMQVTSLKMIHSCSSWQMVTTILQILHDKKEQCFFCVDFWSGVSGVENFASPFYFGVFWNVKKFNSKTSTLKPNLWPQGKVFSLHGHCMCFYSLLFAL